MIANISILLLSGSSTARLHNILSHKPFHNINKRIHGKTDENCEKPTVILEVPAVAPPATMIVV